MAFSPASQIADIIDEIVSINDLISDVVVYKREVVLLREWLTNLIEILENSPYKKKQIATYEENDALLTISNNLSILGKTIQMLTEGIWLGIAATWPVESPTNDFMLSTETIGSSLHQLHLSIEKYQPTGEDFTIDYHEIYECMNALSRQFPAAKDRLVEIANFLQERNLPKATSKNEVKILEVFNSFKQYQVNREDFEVGKKIGFGASGTVFIGTNRKTGEKVAIKQLNATELIDYEIECLRRELAILTSLHHPRLVEFLGATSDAPYWIITKYIEKGSLDKCLRSNSLGPTDLSRIAYQAAEGVAYLHSKNIIHRDIKSLNILINDSNEAFVSDFGISRSMDVTMTGKIGTFNYMAPEVIEKSKYSLKADTFSFGMMLWEMLTRTVPFGNMNQNAIGEQIKQGIRPDIPRTTPRDLASLITSCWDQDPNSRPSFAQILEIMRRKIIMFPGADKHQMKEFYKPDKQANYQDIVTMTTRKTSLINVQFNQAQTNDSLIFELLAKTPQSPQLMELLKSEVLNGNTYTIEKLQKGLFIEKMLPNLEKVADIKIASSALCYVINSSAFISNFINAGGIDVLTRLLLSQDENKVNSAKVIINHIASSISIENSIALLEPCLQAQQYDSCVRLIEGKRNQLIIDTIGKYTKQLLSGPMMKERGILFNIYVSSAGLSDELATQIDAKLVLSNESVDFTQKICDISAFTDTINQNDAVEIIKTISVRSNSQEKRASALILASFLPASVLRLLASRPQFIDDILDVSNLDVVGKFLFKLAQFPECATYLLLERGEDLKRNIKTTSIFSLYIRLGAFYPEKVLEDEVVIKRIVELLSSKSSPKIAEVCFRICGVLSSSEKFKPYAEPISDLIFALIKNGVLTRVEISLAVGVLYNISKLIKFKKLPSQVLSLAESDSPFAGLVLRIAARCKIPKDDGPISGRFLDLILHFISGDDKYGRVAACELLIQTVDNPNYKHAVELSSAATRLNDAMRTEKQADIFIQLAKVSNAYNFPVSTEAINACDAILTQPTTDFKLAEILRTLRSSLRKRQLVEVY